MSPISPISPISQHLSHLSHLSHLAHLSASLQSPIPPISPISQHLSHLSHLSQFTHLSASLQSPIPRNSPISRISQPGATGSRSEKSRASKSHLQRRNGHVAKTHLFRTSCWRLVTTFWITFSHTWQTNGENHIFKKLKRPAARSSPLVRC